MALPAGKSRSMADISMPEVDPAAQVSAAEITHAEETSRSREVNLYQVVELTQQVLAAGTAATAETSKSMPVSSKESVDKMQQVSAVETTQQAEMSPSKAEPHTEPEAPEKTAAVPGLAAEPAGMQET
jgi:hypothetical protein